MSSAELQRVTATGLVLETAGPVTVDNISAEGADHIILATGALRRAPPIPGKDQRHVFDGDQLRGVLFGNDPQAIAKLHPFHRLVLFAGRISQLLRSITLLRFLSKIWMPIARDVVVIGGGLVGLELAEYLVERGRKVTILEPGKSLGAELAIVRRARVLHTLKAHGVVIHGGATISAISNNQVLYELKGEPQAVDCQQVIIAMGAEGDNSLQQQLASGSATVHRIGDCREVGYIDGAILDARHLVQQLETA